MMASDAVASANTTASSSVSSPRHMSENHGSPTAAAAGGAQSRRPGRQASPAWNQSFHRESEPIATAAPSSPQSRAAIQPIASVTASPSAPLATGAASAWEDEKSEGSVGVQGNAGKKPAWNRPSNGASEVGPVMGASSWPALSETTKAPSNKSSSDSLKSLSEGSPSSSSVPVSQGTGNVSVPVQKQPNNTQPNPNAYHSRQRSFKRNGSFSSANGNVANPMVPGSFAELPLQSPSPRGHSQRNGSASQPQGGNDSQSQRNSYRNQNGNHHQNHGGRRNQEHGNHNWNRNFNGRDGHAPSPRGTPGYVRHAPPSVQQPLPAPFLAPQPIPPFGSPVAFAPELALPIYYPRMPFIAAPVPNPFVYHVQDPPLYTKIQNQIHFYFSEENLIKDTYLRQFMDDQGFVQIQLIASFRKVLELTDTVQHILDALQGSPVVEVQGDKVRKRHNWQKFLLPADMRVRSGSSSQSTERVDTLATQVRNLSLEQNSGGHVGTSSSHPVQASKTLTDEPIAENRSDAAAVSSPPPSKSI